MGSPSSTASCAPAGTNAGTGPYGTVAGVNALFGAGLAASTAANNRTARNTFFICTSRYFVLNGCWQALTSSVGADSLAIHGYYAAPLAGRSRHRLETFILPGKLLKTRA